jgi:DNA-directed RNA polymerase subunit RPC12/RpoP
MAGERFMQSVEPKVEEAVRGEISMNQEDQSAFRCWKCGNEIHVVRAQAAAKIECPHCRSPVTVPEQLFGPHTARTIGPTPSTTQQQSPAGAPKVIFASALMLQDENGKVRAMLAATKDGPGLDLFDEDGKPRAGMVVNKSGTALALFAETGHVRATLGVRKDGPALDLGDENGKLCARLGAHEDGPGLVLFDEDGKPRAGMGVPKDGPWLAVSGPDGKTLWSVP